MLYHVIYMFNAVTLFILRDPLARGKFAVGGAPPRSDLEYGAARGRCLVLGKTKSENPWDRGRDGDAEK